MNWETIIENGQLVYQSKENDVPFRNWSLKKTRCNVSYYETYPLDDIDIIMCSLLSCHNGALEEYDIATIMGFNVKDNFDVTPKRYADIAELQLFRALVKPVFEWGLISKSTSKELPATYFLTELGKRAFEKNEKYKFYTGTKTLFENYGICATSAEDSDFFPYFHELDIYSEISNQYQIKYESIDASVFNSEESDLIKRMHLQSATHYNIFKAEKTVYFEIGSTKVDFRILLYDNSYYPVIFQQDKFRSIATELLNNNSNIGLKDKKVEWGLYLRLMNDESAVLDYSSISPFEDILDFDNLIPDKRLAWYDDSLFSFIVKNATANQNASISRCCPLETIKKHIKEDVSQWDWTILSQRFDEKFIHKNYYFPWDYEIVSFRQDVSIDTIKLLLVIPELKDVEWNWDIIMPQLDFNFIKENIHKVDFDLFELTKNNNQDVELLISQNPNRRWDWEYISDEYDLGFVLDNIRKFAYEQNEIQYNYLNLRTIIERAFTSAKFSEQYCTSTIFKDVLTANTVSLSSFSLNTSNYLWTPNMIAFLEDVGLLTWESGSFFAGFECNPYLHWNKNFFDKYCHKIQTHKGFSYVSSKVDDAQIVIDNIAFDWDWEKLSENDAVIVNDAFVKAFIGKLSLQTVLPRISGLLIEELFLVCNLTGQLANDTDLWGIVTRKVSVEFVRKHLNYNWDWIVLTQRFYTTININAIGNKQWVDKWDWQFLTQNLDWNIVYENIADYYEYWDWQYLTKKLDKDYIMGHLSKYISYWDWAFLIDSRFDKSDLLFTSSLFPIAKCISALSDNEQTELWNKLTRKFTCQELADNIHITNQKGKNSILFKWDYEYFYSMPEFDIIQYLEAYLDDIQWELLSKSPRLNEFLKWDKIYSESRWIKNVRNILKDEDYLWDFKELSRLDSINYHIDVLTVRTFKWDWKYLTTYSKIFDRGKDFKRNFYKFKQYINFDELSKRKGTGVNKDLIRDNIDNGWNWIALSNNISVKLDIDFIKEFESKPWDWQALSARTDIELDNGSLYELVDKDWNWQLISSRKDIVFDENCIVKLYSKPMDWFAVSQNNCFVPNQNTLSRLKGEKLDWNSISSNNNLDVSVLWDYKDCLNWENVTRNKIDCTDIEQLERFNDYLDWHFISVCDNFEVTTDHLLKFKSKLDWRAINQRNDFIITNETIDIFADVIDWNKASQSQNIQFSENFLESYRSKWNWRLLRSNPTVIERLGDVLNRYKAEMNCADFVDGFPQTPYIYHFTHLFNAIEIIKSRKILSRHRAEGHFSNAAGNLVERRSTAHEFARFYFRPQTPTQFYNECLGWDSRLRTSWGQSYFSKALDLGLPKCPLPVFFKFDLEEVVCKMSDKCYYSTGNMQTNWASPIKIGEDPKRIKTEYLYYNMSDAYDMACSFGGYDRNAHRMHLARIREQSQQEFLVLNEFDFSELHSFEIICYDEEQANILRNQLSGDNIADRITTYESNDVFHRNNRKLNINDCDENILISSDYCGDAHFEIITSDKNIVNVSGSNVIKETANSILAYPTIVFSKSEIPIEVHFVDERNRDWIVYKN